MVQQLERCPKALEAVGSKPGSSITAFSPSPRCQGGGSLLIAWAFGEVKQCSSMRDRQPAFGEVFRNSAAPCVTGSPLSNTYSKGKAAACVEIPPALRIVNP